MEICPFNFKRQHLSIGRIIFLLLFLTGVLTIYSQLVFGFAPEEKQPPSYQSRTLKFFIFQNPAVMVNGSSSTTPFDIFIGEKDPLEIKDAYIEITGVTNGAGAITAAIRATQGSNCVQAFPNTAKTFNLDSFGQPNHFSILYTGTGTSTDASLLFCLQQIILSPGAYSFEFKVNVSGADVSALHARMVITYLFTPPTSGNLPVLGYVISSTVDTEITKGAAFNSLMWEGDLNGGKVRLQLATSNLSTGPWNDSDFKGPNCTSGTFYEPASDTPIEINPSCASTHNNKRYFRYKATLCSNDCSSAGSNNPQVNDVVVNWSP